MKKGFDLLLESVRLIQDYLRSLNYEVHIYGDGKEKLQLQEFINQYDLGILYNSMNLHKI